MALDAGSVYAVLEGKFHPGGFLAFDGAMKRSEGHTNSFERALLRTTSRGSTALRALGTAAGYGAAGGIAALSVAVVSSVKAAGNFEAALERVHTQAGATQKEVDKMRGALLKLGPEVGQSPTKLADALYHVESAGFRGARALAIVRNASKLAAIGNSDLESTTNAVVAVLKSEIGGVKGASDAIAQMNAIVGQGNMKMQDLTGAISTGLLSSAKAVGLTFRDVGSALDLMTSKGTPAEEAATRLRMTFSLMAAPTSNAQKALKQIGLSSDQLAIDMRKPNGLTTAIADLRKHLDDSGKSAVAQNQILSQAFGGGRSSAAILAMVQNVDQLRKNFDAIGKNATPHVVADAWKKTTETTAHEFDHLKASIQSAGVIIGSALLPELGHLAEKLNAVLLHARESGQLERIGHDLAHGLEEGAKAIPTIVDGLHLIFQAAGFGVHEIEALVNAFGGMSIVGPALLGAAGGLAALRVAQTVVPPLIAVATGLNDIALAARAGGIAFAAEALLSMINPATAVAAAFVGLGAAIAIVITRESYEEQLAKQVAAAKRDQAVATNQLRDAEDSSADATLGAQRAHLSLFQARRQLAEVTKQYGKGSSQYKDALLNEKQAGLQWVEAHKRMIEEARKLDDHQRNVSVKSTDDYTRALKRVDDAQKSYTDAVKRDGVESTAAQGQAHRLAEAKKTLAQVTADLQKAQDRGGISAIDEQRKMQGLEPIAKKNQAAVSLLTSILNRVPEKKRTKLEADDQDALAKLGHLVPKLIAYGQIEKAAKLLANSANAEQGLSRIRALLNSIPATKTVNVQINTSHSGGGGAFGLNTPAPKKHARGARVDRPEFFEAGEDFNREYIIPVQGPYAGRGLELWMQAGRDFGIPGFKGGKPPKRHAKKHRAIPPKRDPLSLPVDTFVNDERNAQSRYDEIKRNVEQDDRQIQSLEQRASTTTKGKSAAGARAQARKQLAAAKKKRDVHRAALKRAKTDLDRRNAELHDAQDFAAQIKKQEDLVEIAREGMELADKQDDQKAYDSAKGRRAGALDKLKDLYNRALGHIRPGTPYARAIQIALGQTLNDIQDVSTMVNEPETSAAEQEMLTTEQQKRLDGIEAAVALASLTEPLSDDQAALGDLVSFRESVLAGLQGSGAPSSLIAEAANDVKSARDELAALTSGGSSGGPSADLQAQVDQANRRAQIAEDTARIATKSLATLRGAGDLGLGGGVVQNIYSLHPADPRTLDLIRNATVGAIDQGTSRQAPRQEVGL